METSTPTPVSFKSLASSAPNALTESSVAVKTLQLQHMDVEYHKPANTSGYYLLVNHSDPSNPIQLYQSGMNKLHRQLEFAIEEATKLESQDHLPDNELYDCGIINKYGNMTVRLVLSTFKNKAFIWLRLYVLNPEKECLPTKRGVRFSAQDDLHAFGDFISGYQY